jgi:hypothetical protein
VGDAVLRYPAMVAGTSFTVAETNNGHRSSKENVNTNEENALVTSRPSLANVMLSLVSDSCSSVAPVVVYGVIVGVTLRETIHDDDAM